MTVLWPLSRRVRIALTEHQSNSTDEPILYTPDPRTITPLSLNSKSCSEPLYVM